MTDNALVYRKAKVFHDLDRMKEGSTHRNRPYL
jgi:hypothetical protein